MNDKLRKLLVGAAFDPHWTCAVCGREIFGGGYFCRDCLQKLPFNDKAFCAHCGRALDAPAPVCDTCANRLPALDAGRSVFCYEGAIPPLIRKFKYSGARWLADAFADDLARLYRESGFTADAAVYVPMRKAAQRKRGYNQTELLARAFSERTGVPAICPLVKRKPTKRQAALAGDDRMKNLEGSFAAAERHAAAGKTLVVIDDVTTTGATLQAMAVALKKNGAKRVYALTIASVSRKGHKNPKS